MILEKDMENLIYGHEAKGYEYLLELDYDEEYAKICLTHSFLNQDTNCTAGGIPQEKEIYKYNFIQEYVNHNKNTIYEKMIQLCDLSCKDEMMGLEARLLELIIRKGAYENTQYHVKEAFKLRAEIEDLMSCNLYELFPEMIAYLKPKK